MAEEKRGGFNSGLGTILVMSGSAVGLGCIWRFPYMVAENGGAAFILIYIAMMFLICVPAFMSEVALGRHARKNIFGAFKLMAPHTQWRQVGTLGVISAFLLASFYCVIGGWTLAFLFKSAINAFAEMAPSSIPGYFNEFVNAPIASSAWAVGYLALSVVILMFGVAKGIERSSKILMPMLLVIMILMIGKSLMLENYWQGIEFLFKPDFSEVNLDMVLAALGQAFFSMSLGMGSIITYGSYARRQDNVARTSVTVAVISVVVAILAGLMIFPAVFAFGIPMEEGSRLAFVTFPAIFQQMSGGYFFGVIFFLLLLVAATTSSISMIEVIVAYAVEEFKLSRRVALSILFVLMAVSTTICAMSLADDSSLRIAGRSVFAFFDMLLSSYLFPIGSLSVLIFVGWRWSKQSVRDELSSGGLFGTRYFGLYWVMIRFVIPIFILLIFLSQLGLV